MIEKKQHELNDTSETVLSNQSIRSQYLIHHIAKSIVISINTILFNKSYNFIDRFFIICSTYFFDNCTSQHLSIYLFARQFFQRLHEHFTHYNSKKILNYTRSSIKLTRFFQFRSKRFIDSFVNNSFFSEFARTFSSQSEIFDQNIRVCKSNRRVFSVFDRECTSLICIENLHSKQFSIRSSWNILLSWVSLRNVHRKQLSFVRRNRRLQRTKRW